MNEFTLSNANQGEASAQEHISAEDKAQQSLLQESAGVVQEHATATKTEDDYTLSIDDIRRLFISADLDKSKDSLWRYCRDGKVDAIKKGLLQRYFATEESVKRLISELQLDATASEPLQLHEAEEENYDTKETNLHETADSDVQLHATEAKENDGEISDLHEPEVQDVAGGDDMLNFLKDQIRVKDDQLKIKDEQIATMLERDRETNILIKELQGAFTTTVKALPDVRASQEREVAQTGEVDNQQPGQNPDGV